MPPDNSLYGFISSCLSAFELDTVSCVTPKEFIQRDQSRWSQFEPSQVDCVETDRPCDHEPSNGQVCAAKNPQRQRVRGVEDLG